VRTKDSRVYLVSSNEQYSQLRFFKSISKLYWRKYCGHSPTGESPDGESHIGEIRVSPLEGTVGSEFLFELVEN
jgi:hypothetical protein